MKKLLAIFLMVSMIITLTACGSDKENESVIGGADGSTDIQVTDDSEDDKEEVGDTTTDVTIIHDENDGTIVVSGKTVSDFNLLADKGEDATFFIDLCDTSDETIYSFCLEFIGDSLARLDDNNTGISQEIDSGFSDLEMEFYYDASSVDLSNIQSVYYYYFDDSGESSDMNYYDISEVNISISGTLSESSEEAAAEDNLSKDSSWSGVYVGMSDEGDQERASEELVVTENTITFTYDDTEFVLDYDINALVTAPEISNHEYGENNAAYASSNDNDFVIVFSDLDKRRIEIYNITLLDTEDYLVFTLMYEENLYPDFDPATEDWTGTYHDYMDNELTITRDQIIMDIDDKSYVFEYDFKNLQPSTEVGEDTASCLYASVDGQDFILYFEATNTLTLYMYDPLAFAYGREIYNKD